MKTGGSGSLVHLVTVDMDLCAQSHFEMGGQRLGRERCGHPEAGRNTGVGSPSFPHRRQSCPLSFTHNFLLRNVNGRRVNNSRVRVSNMQSDADAPDPDPDADAAVLMAAAAWASDQDEDVEPEASKKKKKRSKKSTKRKRDAAAIEKDAEATEDVESKRRSSTVDTCGATNPPHTSPPKAFSLHLTKVPFEVAQGDIRLAFGKRGCNVCDVRLVYDRDQSTGARHFRGVAFVDVMDEKSLQRGLELHNTPFLGRGRRVCVRPTRTKGELSEIVKRTEGKVAKLIARSKEKHSGEGSKAHKRKEGQSSGGSRKESGPKRSESKSKEDGSEMKHEASAKKRTGRHKGNASRKQRDKRTHPASATQRKGKEEPEAGAKRKIKKAKFKHGNGVPGSSHSPPKLTKKERAKKAAIIRMRKNK